MDGASAHRTGNVDPLMKLLCYCVLQLDAGGLDYGLELPDQIIEPAKGSEHYLQVMKSLALYNLKEDHDNVMVAGVNQ